MALTISGTIYYDNSLPATDSNPILRNPVLTVNWSTGSDNTVYAAATFANTGGAVVKTQTYIIASATVDAISTTTSGTSNKTREAVEKCVRDILNTLNGATVCTWA